MTHVALGMRALVVLTVATGCGTDIVRLATLDGGAGGAGETGAGDAAATCRTDSDCGDGGEFFCSKTCVDPLAGPSATGTCKLVPADPCPDNFMPVCGCDQVTYFNDCFRSRERAAWFQVGTCQGAQLPLPFAACGLRRCATGTCAHLVPAGFPADVCNAFLLYAGSCWKAPDRCSLDSNPGPYMPCDGGACVDMCTAIQMGTPYQLVAPAQCPR
jgi:hypothetical protein